MSKITVMLATGKARCVGCNKFIHEGDRDCVIVVNTRAAPHWHPECLERLGVLAKTCQIETPTSKTRITIR